MERLRPWWRFWRSDRIFKDQADHEWTTWKITALQSNYNSRLRIMISIFLLFLVGMYVALFPVFSWLTKRFLKDYSLLLNVMISTPLYLLF